MLFKLAVFSTAINILALIMPLALLQVYDRILPNQSSGTAFVIFSAVAVALLLAGVLRLARARAFSRVSATSDHHNWMIVANRMMAQNTDLATARHLMDIPPKARDFEAGEAAVGLYDAPFVLIFLSLIWFLGGDVVLAPVAIVVLATAVVLMSRKQGVAARNSFAHDTGAMESKISQLALGATSDLRSVAGRMSDLSTLLRRRAKSAMGVELAGGRQLDLMQIAGLATTVLVVGFGAAAVLKGNMTTGGLAACTLLGSRAASQGIGAILAVSRKTDTKAANAEMRRLERMEENAATAEDTIQILTEALSLDGAPQNGVILIAGDARKHEAAILQSVVTALWSSGAHRSDAVLVPARPEFMRGTLIENLSGFETESEQAALDLSIALGLDVMVGRLAQGYETEVSRTESGGLSHGAVKRAMIVQALVGCPRLLLLERPAAGLDLEGRSRLASVLKERANNLIVVMTTSEEVLVDIATKRVQVPVGGVQGGGVS